MTTIPGPRVDVLVVGRGIAGLGAALAARREGARVAVVGGPSGSTALAGGAWDIATEVFPSLDEIFAPTRSLAVSVLAIARDREHHPYARFGPEVLDLLTDAHALVLGALELYRPIDLLGHGVLLATELGIFRRAATAQHQVLAIPEPLPARIAVHAPGGSGVDPSFVARSLSDLLARAERPCRVVAVPPGSALAQSADLVLTLGPTTASAGHQGEVLATLASEQSLRLSRAIDRAFQRSGCEQIEGPARELRVQREGTRVVCESGREIAPGATVLATGKFLGGGVTMVAGELIEPLAGLPIFGEGRPLLRPTSEAGRDPALVFGRSPFVGGPGYRYGVGYDEQFRGLDRNGRRVARDLFVAGALLEGFDPSRDGTGLGCATTTGVVAGRNAARSLASRSAG